MGGRGMIADPFATMGTLLREFLVGLGLQAAQANALVNFLGAGALATAVLPLTFFLIWVERKVLARIQDRLGPNRVGPFGLLQTIADAVKLLTKEVIVPAGADKLIYFIAPPLTVMSVVGLWAVIPLAPNLVGTDINVGVIYLIPTMLAGSMGTVAIVEGQREMWFVVLAPLAAFLFFTSSMAEAGKAPFDLLEAESEIVAGYNIEYSSMAFGMFFVGEFLHGFTLAALTATLFLGGWLGPGVDRFPLLGLVYFGLKSALVYFGVIWIPGRLPRLRIDQVNAVNWKFLVPLSLAVVAVTAIADKLAALQAWNRIVTLGISN